jgi:acetyltransferase AlgX (SGNH hydrolase-like protein)
MYVPRVSLRIGDAALGPRDSSVSERTLECQYQPWLVSYPSLSLAPGDVATARSIDLLPWFKREVPDAEHPLYFPKDQHWTAEGHDLAAQIVAAELRQRDLVPGRSYDGRMGDDLARDGRRHRSRFSVFSWPPTD